MARPSGDDDRPTVDLGPRPPERSRGTDPDTHVEPISPFDDQQDDEEFGAEPAPPTVQAGPPPEVHHLPTQQLVPRGAYSSSTEPSQSSSMLLHVVSLVAA